MTPFEAVYGRQPPTIVDYIAGTSKLATVDNLLQNRTELLARLRTNLYKAQQRMKHFADGKRTDCEFDVGDLVYVRLQPYRQHSVHRRRSPKLAQRFYGPYHILDRIGKVAYRVELPESSKIHNVVHVSVLKKCKADQQPVDPTWPTKLLDIHPIIQPLHIVGFRQIMRGNCPTPQVLVQWEGQGIEEASWEDWIEFRNAHAEFNLEDEVSLDEEGNVRVVKRKEVLGRGARQLIPSKRYPSQTYAKQRSNFQK
ncbi:unnamed protein product [Rhodiola kirilowii]